MTEIPDEVRDAVDERITWIKAVVGLGLKHGVEAIRDEIDKLDDETARSILFVLLVHYLAEGELLRDALARQQFESLDGDNGPTLH